MRQIPLRVVILPIHARWLLKSPKGIPCATKI